MPIKNYKMNCKNIIISKWHINYPIHCCFLAPKLPVIGMKPLLYRILYENVFVTQRFSSKRCRIFSMASAFELTGCVRERGDFASQTFECNTRDGIFLEKKKFIVIFDCEWIKNITCVVIDLCFVIFNEKVMKEKYLFFNESWNNVSGYPGLGKYSLLIFPLNLSNIW